MALTRPHDVHGGDPYPPPHFSQPRGPAEENQKQPAPAHAGPQTFRQKLKGAVILGGVLVATVYLYVTDKEVREGISGFLKD